jgi:hypothetical protein
VQIASQGSRQEATRFGNFFDACVNQVIARRTGATQSSPPGMSR